ncbi:MAG: TVP38/TMEM64 family protein [Verrucomicrobia bacterium]|nr:TVP38/TMEM64 family protein [Verrucomicrobiota bacterium]
MAEPDNKLIAGAGTAAEREEIAKIERSAFRKAGVLFAVLAGLVLLTSLPQVRHFISENLPVLKQSIHECGPWAPVVFMGVVAVMVAAGISRLAFHFIGGALFAFWGGMIWTCIGTMIGYSAVFLAVRQLGLRDSLLRKHPTWQKLAGKLKHNTVPAVILFRQLPLPGIVTNTVLALSPIRRREFFLGTVIGLIPEAVPATLIGAGLRKEDIGTTAAYMVGAVALFIVIWIAWGIYTRRAAAREGMLEQDTE